MKVLDGQTIVVWFSCGAASAVAAKRTIEKYGHRCIIRVVNNPVAEEDADNRRFLKDVEKWLGVPIEIATNPAWPNLSAEEVWKKRRWMSGPKGAPCTGELKREARALWESRNHFDHMVMGFTADEERSRKRYSDFIKTERSNVLPILIEDGITKADCFRILTKAGLELPLIYKLGYPNANCIGCVKVTSPKYWNHVRKVHPAVFAQRVALSREIGCKLVEVGKIRIMLDELDPNEKRGRPLKSIQNECGIYCEENPTRARALTNQPKKED